MKTQPYTESFKDKMVRQMLGPRAKTATLLSREVGIPQPTLSRWFRAADRSTVMTKGKDKSEPAPAPMVKTWTAREKFRVLVAAEDLAGDELGAFLRREGLHTAQLIEWRAATTAALDTKPGRGSASSRRIKDLEKELRRKDKALAETAALLVLSKKMKALWSSTEADDTDDSSET